MTRPYNRTSESSQISNDSKPLYKFVANAEWFESIRRYPVALILMTVLLFACLDFISRVVEAKFDQAKQNRSCNQALRFRRNAMTTNVKHAVASGVTSVKESVMHGGMGIALVSFRPFSRATQKGCR